MSSKSKKRRAADESDEDQRPAPNVAKKTKLGVAADGEDDDGNPFWEVSRQLGVESWGRFSSINVALSARSDGVFLGRCSTINWSVFSCQASAVSACQSSRKRVSLISESTMRKTASYFQARRFVPFYPCTLSFFFFFKCSRSFECSFFLIYIPVGN